MRIRIREGKNDPQKRKKWKKFALKWYVFFLRAGGFSCSLDVLYVMEAKG
jgi:hypothetical protein